jgi:cell wall-associated NlpC family hydrolase
MPTDLVSVLDSLKKSQWPDNRTTWFAVEVQATENSVRLTGEVLTDEQRTQAEQAIHQAAPQLALVNEIAVLSRPDTPWALIRGGVSNIRRSPGNSTELTAQALFGEPVELLKRDERGWWLVRIADGYLGWTTEEPLSVCDRLTAQAYRAQADALVSAELALAYTGPERSAILHVGRLPFGAPVCVFERRDEMVRVNWAGEPPLWVQERDLLPISERPRPDAAGISRTLNLMSRFIGVPYLWGGESPYGYDCSGFAQTTLEFLGAGLPRDADMQYAAGQPVQGDPRPGDLLFFRGKSSTPSHAQRTDSITHVAVSLGGTEFIHATQIVWGVQRNSLDPASPIYRATLRERLAGVRRFV